MLFIDELNKVERDYSAYSGDYPVARSEFAERFCVDYGVASSVCSKLLTGEIDSPVLHGVQHTTETRRISLYGISTEIPETITYDHLKGLGLTWLSCVETYIIRNTIPVETMGDRTYQAAYVYENFRYTEDAGYVEDDEDSLDDYGADPARLYGFKADPSEYVGDKTMYFGMELELEFRDSDNVGSAVKAAHEAELCLSSDGSLDDGGEFKTPPCTYKYIMPLIEKVCTIAEENDMHDESTCGLHIHVSRAAMSDLSIAKVVGFMNNPANRRFIVRLAGRESDYARFTEYNPYKMYCNAQRYDRRFSGDKKHIFYDEKYAAVNTRHPHTIEFRIFKSSTDPVELKRNLQFVKTLCEFAKSCTSLRQTTHSSAYLEYVNQPMVRKEHPELTDYLRNSGYLTKPVSHRTKVLNSLRQTA